MMGLTPAQAACLKAIRDLTVDGVPPTWEALRVRLGFASKSGVSRLMAGLKDRGAVHYRYGQRHTLYILGESPAISIDGMENMPLDELRRHIAVASGILAHRAGGPNAAEIIHRIADRLPGAARRAA